MNKIKLSISALRVAVFIAIFLAAAPWEASTQVQDTTPPQLVTLSYSPMSIDVSSGSQNVTITVRITDNLSGLSSGGLFFRSPSGQQIRQDGFQYPNSLTSGTAQDGTYQFTVSFPQFSEAGTWHVLGMGFLDQVGNSRNLSETDLINLGFPTTLEVTGGPDLASPQLVTLGYSPMSIDTSSGSQNVTITVRITDNLSGLSSGGLFFRSPSGQQIRQDGFQYPNSLTSGTAQDGTYQFTISFPQFSEAGTWHILGMGFLDQVGNSRNLSETDLINLGFLTTLEVAQNRPPVAMCRNVTVSAGSSGTADASINDGSFDPDSGDTITITQSPAGPYALGVTTATLTVTDNHGTSSSCSAAVTVVDTTAPAISCPAPITVDGSNSSGGAVVTYSVTATDNCDPSPSVSVTPPSGSLFPFGATTVTATATDDSGNSSQCSFTVTVRSPQDQATQITNQVQDLVTGGALTQDQGAGLTDKLNEVITKLNQGQTNAACNQLDSFINQVNAFIGSGSLTPAQGQALINAANVLKANIGC